MSMIEVCGFAGFASGGASLWGWSQSGTYGLTISTGRGGGANKALYLYNDSNNFSQASHQFCKAVTSGTAFLGFAWWTNAATSGWNQEVVYLTDASGPAWCTFGISPSGFPTLWDSTGTVIATGGTAISGSSLWRYAEVSVNVSTKAIVAKLDGTTVVSGTSTTAAPSGGIQGVKFGHNGRGDYTHLITDLYFLDSSGSQNNTYLGDCRVETLTASADGANLAWTPDTGTAHYSRVNEAAADGDTTYVASTTIGARDTYTMTDMASTAGVIQAVQVTNIAKRQTTVPATLGGAVKISSTSYDSPIGTTPPTAGYGVTPGIFEKSPATATTWTSTEVNGMEAGPVITA